MAEAEERNKTLAIDALFNKRDSAAAEWFWSPKYIQHSAYIHPDVRARSTRSRPARPICL